jgi:hypothetical protein
MFLPKKFNSFPGDSLLPTKFYCSCSQELKRRIKTGKPKTVSKSRQTKNIFMAENQFVVDLGPVKLTAEQHQNISNAIQSAVASEVAKLGSANKIALVPVNKWVKGPIIDGIVARDITKNFDQFLAGK